MAPYRNLRPLPRYHDPDARRDPGLKRRFLLILLLLPLLMFPPPNVEATPPTVYCYETFDTQAFLTYNPKNIWNDALSTTKTQGSHSLRVHNHTLISPTANHYITSSQLTTIPSGQKVLGFWFRLEQMDISNDTMSVLLIDYVLDRYIGVDVVWEPSHATWELAWKVKGSGGATAGYWGAVAFNAWYWMECFWTNANDQSFRLNGTGLGGASGYGVTLDGVDEQVWISYAWQKTCGESYFDFMRIASDYEFPPTYPQSRVIIYARDTLGNQTQSVEMSVNGTYYYTTHNQTYDQSDVLDVVMGTNQWFNETHSLVFLNWSDGSTSRTKILTVTGEIVETAYYTWSRKWDPGGWTNFLLGLIGLLLMGGSFIFAKSEWDDGDYGSAIGIWIGMFVIGFGLFTVLVGG